MKKRSPNLWTVALSLALTAGVAASFSESADAQEGIKIGVLEPFTGPWAKNGNESYVAMEIARDMTNERGGVKGQEGFLREG